MTGGAVRCCAIHTPPLRRPRKDCARVNATSVRCPAMTSQGQRVLAAEDSAASCALGSRHPLLRWGSWTVGCSSLGERWP